MSFKAQISEALVFHQCRRAEGVPTVSVLTGPTGLAIHEWRRWRQKQGRPVVIVDRPDEINLVNAWVQRLAESGNLVKAAIGYTANKMGSKPRELENALDLKIPYELALYFDNALPSKGENDLDAVCRRILKSPSKKNNLEHWVEDFSRSGGRPFRLMASICRLMNDADVPSVLLVKRDRTMSMMNWLGLAVRICAGLAEQISSLPTALVVGEEDFNHYLQETPETREKAILRETVVPVHGWMG